MGGEKESVDDLMLCYDVVVGCRPYVIVSNGGWCRIS